VQWSEELRASLEGLAARHQERIGELRRMQGQLDAIAVTARSRDGMVRVAAGPHGELRDLYLDPMVFSRLSPQRLADTIMELIAESARDAAAQAREVSAGFLPDDLAGRLRGGGEDLLELLPAVPSLLYRRGDS
jgi:DNA-binding protein YbaB